MKKFLNEVISFIYPKKCVICGKIIDEDHDICLICDLKLKPIDYKNICIVCGKEKQNCICKKRVFYFNSIFSAYYYDGDIKKAILNFKFNNKGNYAKFFADKTAQFFNLLYHDKKFDIICYVPSSRLQTLKRGYDHSKLLATRLSEYINLPVVPVLKSKNFVPKQHKSTFAERHKNVKGKYSATRRIDGMRVLLIDDIVTTGSTLNECARVLYLAGAVDVCAATPIMTYSGKERKGDNGDNRNRS